LWRGSVSALPVIGFCGAEAFPRFQLSGFVARKRFRASSYSEVDEVVEDVVEDVVELVTGVVAEVVEELEVVLSSEELDDVVSVDDDVLLVTVPPEGVDVVGTVASGVEVIALVVPVEDEVVDEVLEDELVELLVLEVELDALTACP